MKKKVVLILVVVLLLLSLKACGAGKKQSPTTTPTAATSVINTESEKAGKAGETEPEEAPAPTEPIPEVAEPEVTDEAESAEGIRPEFKNAMDSYEDFYVKYCEFMAEYKNNPTDMGLLMQYSQMMQQLVEMDEAFDTWESEDLSSEELKYYLEVNNRVMQMLVGVMN